VRPNITREEALFIAEALRSYKQLMGEKVEEMQERERRIAQYREIMLKQDAAKGAVLLREERQLYSLDKQQHYYDKEVVASALTRRFKAMANGGRLRSGWLAYMSLQILSTVPKRCEKCES
jgi:hypothetical protein